MITKYQKDVRKLTAKDPQCKRYHVVINFAHSKLTKAPDKASVFTRLGNEEIRSLWHSTGYRNKKSRPQKNDVYCSNHDKRGQYYPVVGIDWLTFDQDLDIMGKPVKLETERSEQNV